MATIQSVVLDIPSNSIPGSALKTAAEIARTQMAQNTLDAFPVDFLSLRTWDAAATNLPGTPAADDLGLLTGTFGTDALTVETGDLKAAGSTSRKARFTLAVPPNYEDGTTIQVRIRAGMETTIADTAATVDLEVYKPAGDGSVGSDLCSTAAQSANSLTEANLDFTIDATGVDPSDKLECVVTFLVNDSATVTAVTGVIYAITLLCDTRG